ncbi:MAG: hypothetical protein LBU89_04535 [Fibromonadaceae bacterium]|nr:hypothetical protein [Fibromonadaceae bacterium]
MHKFNITDELDEIILRNDIDEGFPEFRKYRQAIELIRKFFVDYGKDKRIMLVASSATESAFKRRNRTCRLFSEGDLLI